MKLDASSLRFFGKPSEEVAETSAEQRFQIPLRRAVGVDLHKKIVADHGSQIEPLAY